MSKTTAVALSMKEAMAAEVAALSTRLQAPSGDKIKISNKQFKLPNGDTWDFLDVCIVDYINKNVYYTGPFDQNSITPPDCFSLSAEYSTMAPSPRSPDIQSKIGCAGCTQNQFGSAGKGKACQNRILIAVLPRDATAETPLSILDISPTAIKGFSEYVRFVGKVLGKTTYQVMTHVKCNPNVKHDVAVFGEAQPIEDDDFVALMFSRKAEARERLMTEPDLSAANDAKPVKGRLQAPKRRA